MPILWEEPFGIVMAEAMACGTPVLGLARGAVPEVSNMASPASSQMTSMASYARWAVYEIDRAACRARVERLFSDAAVTEAYLAVYREMLAVRAGGRAAA